MRKFFQSGGAFMVLGLFCIATGLIAENGLIFTSGGMFWIIMAMIVRGKYKKKPPGDES